MNNMNGGIAVPPDKNRSGDNYDSRKNRAPSIHHGDGDEDRLEPQTRLTKTSRPTDSKKTLFSF
ncbi:hypothetical protein [Methylomonas methanica]|uniref:hypothetical protein n=1 Tax=Methylomonas methanica TaxID=421 RepID=UPI0013052090|nr:hypothetical protein [Methylomonas methanica]